MIRCPVSRGLDVVKKCKDLMGEPKLKAKATKSATYPLTCRSSVAPILKYQASPIERGIAQRSANLL